MLSYRRHFSINNRKITGMWQRTQTRKPDAHMTMTYLILVHFNLILISKSPAELIWVYFKWVSLRFVRHIKLPKMKPPRSQNALFKEWNYGRYLPSRCALHFVRCCVTNIRQNVLSNVNYSHGVITVLSHRWKYNLTDHAKGENKNYFALNSRIFLFHWFSCKWRKISNTFFNVLNCPFSDMVFYGCQRWILQ